MVVPADPVKERESIFNPLRGNQGPAPSPSVGPAKPPVPVAGAMTESEEARKRVEAASTHQNQPIERFLEGDPNYDGDVNYCVVCGQGSNRDNWGKDLRELDPKTNQLKVKTGLEPKGTFVACDHHTPEEFSKAIAEVQEKAKVLGLKPQTLRGVKEGPAAPATQATVAASTAGQPPTGPKVVAPAQEEKKPITSPPVGVKVEDTTR